MAIDKEPDSRSIVTERVEPLVCPTCGLVIKSKKVGDGTVYIDIDWTGTNDDADTCKNLIFNATKSLVYGNNI